MSGVAGLNRKKIGAVEPSLHAEMFSQSSKMRFDSLVPALHSNGAARTQPVERVNNNSKRPIAEPSGVGSLTKDKGIIDLVAIYAISSSPHQHCTFRAHKSQ